MSKKPLLKGVAAVLLLLSLACSAGSKAIHQHAAKDIGNSPIPKIQLSAFRDEIDGVNIHIDIENYQLNAPNSVQNAKIPRDILQGHAHVFVNGLKRQRLYGQALHIPASWLRKGVNQVAISLNSHQHENWEHQGKTIVGSVFLDLSKPTLILHNYSSQPIKTHDHSHAH